MKIKNVLKYEKGITLIALIITIIVLLILAGVSINMITGEDGLIAKAGSAKERTAVEQVKEELKLKIADLKTEQLGKISNAEIEDLIKTYDKDGKIKSDDIGKYIETEDGYRVDVDDMMNDNKKQSTIRMANFEGEQINNIPLLEMTESLKLQKLEIKDSKLNASLILEDNSVVEGSLDIITGEYDYVDASSILEVDVLVPAVLVNSDYEVCDLDTNLKSDDYILIIITDLNQIDILKTGNFYFGASFWVAEWYDDVTMYNSELVGTLGIESDVTWYMIFEDGKDTVEVSWLDENFTETEKFVEELKQMEGAKITESDHYNWWLEVGNYKVSAICGLFYEGCPVFSKRESTNHDTLKWDYFFPGPYTLYAADVENDQPNMIRNKVTNQSISSTEFINGFEAAITLGNSSNYLKDYEYYFEDKFYAINNGQPIIFNP